MDGEGSIGNFLALIKLLGEHNNELKAHLEATQGNGKKYLHYQHQNELIDIGEAEFHANMSNEASSFNKEIISL